MAFVAIPFHEQFRLAMLDGSKTQTARTKRYARVGDMFMAFGERFEVLGTTMESLWVVQESWKAEGCTSPEEFKGIWEQLHPRRGFDPEQVVWVHRFTMVGRAEP